MSIGIFAEPLYLFDILRHVLSTGNEKGNVMGKDAGPQAAATGAAPKKTENATTLEEKWGKATMAQRFTVVPSIMLQGQRRLGINANELAVLLHIMEHWWKADDLPWPSKRTIAERLDVSEKTVQRATARMEQLGLIERKDRFLPNSNGRTSNAYDLSGLVARLTEIAEETAELKAQGKKAVWKAQNVAPKKKPANKKTEQA